MSAMVKERRGTIERRDYAGWANPWWLSNGEVELAVPADIGPRVMHHGFTGGRNTAKEVFSKVADRNPPPLGVRVDEEDLAFCGLVSAWRLLHRIKV